MVYSYGWPSATSKRLSCTGGGRCYLGVGSMAPGRGGVMNPGQGTGRIEYQDGENLTAVRARWVRQFGATGTINEDPWTSANPALPPIDWDNICVGFQYWPEGTGTPGILLPESICGRAPPPTKHCDALPDISFDYGALSQQSVIGAQMSQKVRITCGGVQSVSLRMLQPIQLGPDLTSEIQADGKVLGPAGATYNVSQTGREFVFTSTLVGTVGSISGRLSASSVLMVEIL
ncbi:Uncharacterised protein [Serratia proteamaculans]|nr:Uncharacterised protein [Serratia proteamaculans]